MHYNLDMRKHEGKIARIYTIDNYEDTWYYSIEFGRERWCYVEEWVENQLSSQHSRKEKNVKKRNESIH